MNDSAELPLIPDSSTTDVPVYNCIVLVRQDAVSGQVSARVANLDGITANGATERDALLCVTREFKRIVQERIRTGGSIPFLSPPISPNDDESERFVPIHL
jgi:hypothetical protein